MSPFNLVVTIVLFVGVASEVLCALGVLVMRGPFNKLHYAAAGTTVGAFCIGAAIVARETLHPKGVLELSSGGLQALAAVAFLFLLNPALTILTARAARRLEHGTLEPTSAERERGSA
jgi:multisubunit Na+/H+ antiporter MnhG subunit